MFSPDPRNQSLDVRAVVRYDDGSTVIWDVPDLDPFLGAYRDYRWQKWQERVRLDTSESLWRADRRLDRPRAPTRRASSRPRSCSCAVGVTTSPSRTTAPSTASGPTTTSTRGTRGVVSGALARTTTVVDRLLFDRRPAWTIARRPHPLRRGAAVVDDLVARRRRHVVRRRRTRSRPSSPAPTAGTIADRRQRTPPSSRSPSCVRGQRRDRRRLAPDTVARRRVPAPRRAAAAQPADPQLRRPDPARPRARCSRSARPAPHCRSIGGAGDGRESLWTAPLVAPWGLRLVQLQMVVVYFFAFWSKNGPTLARRHSGVDGSTPRRSPPIPRRPGS